MNCVITYDMYCESDECRITSKEKLVISQDFATENPSWLRYKVDILIVKW